MHVSRLMVPLALVLGLAACQEEPLPPKAPPAPPPLTAAEVGTALSAAWGTDGFVARVKELDTRLAASKDPQAQAERDRTVARALLLGCVAPQAMGFAGGLAGESWEGAADALLDGMQGRDAELARKLAPYRGFLKHLAAPAAATTPAKGLTEAWAADLDALAVGLRLRAAKALSAHLDRLLAAPEEGRWESVLRDLGPLACPACPAPTVAGGAPLTPEAFFLVGEPGDLKLAEPRLALELKGSSSVVLLRLLALAQALAAFSPAADADPATRQAAEELQALKARVGATVVPLTLPYTGADPTVMPSQGAPAQPGTGEPAPAAPPAKAAHAGSEAPMIPVWLPSVERLAGFSSQPLLVLSFLPDGLHLGVRPLLKVEGGAFSLVAPEDAFPGPLVADWKALADSLKKKDALAAGGAFKVLAEAVAALKARVPQLLQGLHPAVDRAGLEAGRFLVVAEHSPDLKLLPGIFAAMSGNGYFLAEFVVGHTHTPFGVPAVLDVPEAAAALKALDLPETHGRRLLAVLEREAGPVSLFPPAAPKPGEGFTRATDKAPTAPEGIKEVRDPKKQLFRVEVPLKEAQAEDKLAAAARWLQFQAKAAPHLTLGVTGKGDFAALPYLANALANRAELLKINNFAALLGVKGAECVGTGYCLGSVLHFSPRVTLPEMGKVEKATVVEQRPLGFCAKEGINRVVSGAMGLLKFCYERELQTYPDLAGKVTMTWTIEEDGKLAGITAAEDTLKNKKVTACLTSTIARLKFDKPQGGVCLIRWPFVFTPR